MRVSNKVIALREMVEALKTEAMCLLQTQREVEGAMKSAPERIKEFEKRVGYLRGLIGGEGNRRVKEIEGQRQVAWSKIRRLEAEIEELITTGQGKTETLRKTSTRAALLKSLGAGDQSVIPALVEMESMEWSEWVKKWGHVVKG